MRSEKNEETNFFRMKRQSLLVLTGGYILCTYKSFLITFNEIF